MSRFAIGLTIILLPAVVLAAPTPVTTCGQVVVGTGVLTADLDCGLFAAPAAINLRGSLDLNGFTIIGNPGIDAVICDGRCTVRGPGLITGAHNGISAIQLGTGRIRIRDVTISGNGGAAVSGLKLLVKDSVVTNNGAPDPPVPAPFTGGVIGAHVRIVDSTITDNFNVGVHASKARVIRSTVTGNGSNPGCLANISNWGCADMAGYLVPSVRGSSTCGTSRRLAWAPFNPNWGVCSND